MERKPLRVFLSGMSLICVQDRQEGSTVLEYVELEVGAREILYLKLTC